MTPTLNVNLQCVRHEEGKIGGGIPVLTPCPLPPKVEFTVRLGECDALCSTALTVPASGHRNDCPARPVRVTCSISGETWAGSEVDDVETVGPEDFAHDGLRIVARDACRARWAGVRALVLGQGFTGRVDSMDMGMKIGALLEQRDAEFAALCDMARAEEAAVLAQQRADGAFPFERYRRNDADHRNEPRPSWGRLAAFVDYLIATVGALP